MKYKDHRFTAGALLAISTLIFQAYISQPPHLLDQIQELTFISLAVSIPSLTLWFLISKHSNTYEFKGFPNVLIVGITTFVFAVGVVSSLINVGLAFYRYSTDAGFVFLAVSFIAIIILFLHEIALKSDLKNKN